MSNHTGRAVHWLFVQLPARTVNRAVRRGMALVEMETQRWLTLAVFGVFVFGFWWVALQFIHVAPKVWAVASLLVLIWFWRVYVNAKRSLHNRTWRARQYQIEMEQYRILQRLAPLPEMIQRSLMAAYQAGGGNVRDYGPAHAQTQQMERTQAEQVRGWVEDGTGEPPPAGEWVPVTPLPKWLRRRMRKRGPK